jgi:hypothetical protein
MQQQREIAMNRSLYFKKATFRIQYSWRGLAVLAISAGSLTLLGGMPKAAEAQVAAATEIGELSCVCDYLDR